MCWRADAKQHQKYNRYHCHWIKFICAGWSSKFITVKEILAQIPAEDGTLIFSTYKKSLVVLQTLLEQTGLFSNKQFLWRCGQQKKSVCNQTVQQKSMGNFIMFVTYKAGAEGISMLHSWLIFTESVLFRLEYTRSKSCNLVRYSMEPSCRRTSYWQSILKYNWHMIFAITQKLSIKIGHQYNQPKG